MICIKCFREIVNLVCECGYDPFPSIPDWNWVDKIWRKDEVAEKNWVVHELAVEPGELNYMIFCPACQCGHGFRAGEEIPGRPVWGFNGDMIKPTLFPAGPGHTCSVLIQHCDYRPGQEGKMIRCHYHITNGMIQFCDDCTHDMRGKTVPLEPF